VDNVTDVPMADVALTKSGVFMKTWIEWFLDLVRRLGQTPQMLFNRTYTGQAAAIAGTPIVVSGINARNAGFYEVSVHARVTQAASVNSALQVAIGWTDGGVPQTVVGGALTGNVTTTKESLVLPLHADQAALITYAASYLSVGGTPMQYRLDISVRALSQG
jgi:hypothetical protein